MRASLNEQEIGQIFATLGLSPIERGIQEIQRAKNPPRVPASTSQDEAVLRVVVSNGTGRLLQGDSDAELERGPN